MSSSSQSTLQAPYLINTRQFPRDFELLEPALSKMYIEVAQAVNNRTIGIFEKFQVVTGERWFNPTDNLQKRQTYRQVYTFGAIAAGGTLTIPLNITNPFLDFTRIYGVALTVTNFFLPLPHASIVANGNVSLYVDATNRNIIIKVGAGSDNIASGKVILEYLLN